MPSDITLRALAACCQRRTLIACEDTRVSGKLLAALRHRRAAASPITTTMPSGCGRSSWPGSAPGAAVALVSDAGTPLISDPGFKLVRAAIAEGVAGHRRCPAPRRCSRRWCLSGLPTDRFLFAGFLPPKSARRRRALADLAAVPATLIFFESAPRLAATLPTWRRCWGPAGRGRARADQALRGGPPRRLGRARRPLRGRRARPRARSWWWSARPAAAAPRPARQSTSRLRRGARSMSLRDARRRSPPPPGCRAARSIARALALSGHAGGAAARARGR